MTDHVSRIGMGVLLALSAPINGDTGVWAQWGLAGLVVGYTLWRDWHRERRMSASIERDHRWVQETLVSALERNTQALERMIARVSGRLKNDG